MHVTLILPVTLPIPRMLNPVIGERRNIGSLGVGFAGNEMRLARRDSRDRRRSPRARDRSSSRCSAISFRRARFVGESANFGEPILQPDPVGHRRVDRVEIGAAAQRQRLVLVARSTGRECSGTSPPPVRRCAAACPERPAPSPRDRDVRSALCSASSDAGPLRTPQLLPSPAARGWFHRAAGRGT